MMLLLIALMIMMEYCHDNGLSGPGYATFEVMRYDKHGKTTRIQTHGWSIYLPSY